MCSARLTWVWCIVGLAAATGKAQNGTWNTNSSTNWSVNTSWLGNNIANGATFTANLTFNLTTSSKTVTLDTSRTIGHIVIGDTSTTDNRSFILAQGGASVLTLDNGVSASNITQTSSSAGDTISLPLLLNSSLNITNNDGTNTLTLSATTTLASNNAGLNTVTFGGAGPISMAGVISDGTSGSVRVVKDDPGTLTLSGNNSFSGGVDLNYGTMTISGATNTFTGNISIDGGTFNANSATAWGAGTNVVTITGGTIQNTTAGAITLGGNNAQNWNNDFAFGGTQNLNLGTGAVTMSVSRQITVGGAATFTVGGNIGQNSASSLTTVNGSSPFITSTLVLSGTNNYTGGTNINGGLVRLNNIPATGTITIGSGGALEVSGPYATLAGWLGDSHLSNTSSGALALTAGSAENFDAVSSGFANLSIGAARGSTVIYTGTITPGANGYFAGGGGGSIEFSNTDAFTDAKTVTFGNGGGGTVIVSGNNSYSGATTIAAGTTVQVGKGSTTGTLGTTPSIANSGTLVLNRSDSYTFSPSLSGTGNLIKRGAGAVVLGTNGMTGSVSVENGSLQLSSAATMTELSLGATGSNGSINLGAFNHSATRLLADATVAGNSVLTIGDGKTLTITGTPVGVTAIQIDGSDTSSIQTNLQIRGSTLGTGTLEVTNTLANNNDFLMTNTAASTTTQRLDMSGLGTFTGTFESFLVGTGSGRSVTELTLADNNTITSNLMLIGAADDTVAVTGTFRLGASNTFNATTINIANARTSQNVSFRSGLPGTPLWTIRGVTGGTSRADLILGNNTTNYSGQENGSTASTATLDLRAGSVDFLIDELVLGLGHSVGSNVMGHGIGILSWDQGTINATSVTIGRAYDQSGGTGDPSSATHGTVNVEGAATLTAGSITLADNRDGSSGLNAVIKGALNVSGNASVTVTGNISLANHTSTSTGTSTGTVTLSGGVISVGGNITEGSAATDISTLTLKGGDLDMTAGTINVDTFNAQSGILRNVVAIQSGGVTAALTKTSDGSGSGGTLTLAGTHSYTGATNVNAGKLAVTGSSTNSAFNVTGGTLAGTGSIAGTVAVNAAGHLAPGTVGNDLATGALTFAASSFYDATLDTATVQSDQTTVTGNLNLAGSPALTLTDLGANLRVPDNTVFTLITYTGTWDGGLFNGKPNNSTFAFGANEFRIKYDDISGPTSAVTLTAIPEPGTLTLLGGAVGLLLMRRRRP